MQPNVLNVTAYNWPVREHVQNFVMGPYGYMHLLQRLGPRCFFRGIRLYCRWVLPTTMTMYATWALTLMPTFRHDSPYSAPLSSSAWYLCTGIQFTVFRFLFWIADRCNFKFSTWKRANDLRRSYEEQTLRGMEKEFEETARKVPSEIDGRALMWTYASLDEDHELEQFFSGVPAFCSSDVVDNPQSSLDSLKSFTVTWALRGHLERTWSSNLVSETIKIRRLAISIKAIDAAHLSEAAFEILDVLFDRRPALFRSVELGHSLIGWGNIDDRKTTLFAQGIIACIIANASQRDERWFSLTIHHLGIPEHVPRGLLNHDSSVLLANLIHFTSQFIRNFRKAGWGEAHLTFILPRLGSNYNVQNTLPGVQHDFCRLWNETVQQRDARDHPVFSYILRTIRPIYVALHRDSIPNDQYQLCSNPSHRINLAPNLNEVDERRTIETTRAPITTSTALYRHASVPSIIPPVTEYHAPRSAMPNLDPVIPHLVDEQPRSGVLDNITPVAPSLHLTPEGDQISHRTAVGPLPGTIDPSATSFMVDTGIRSSSSHGTVSRPAMNMVTVTPFFVPDTASFPIPPLAVSPDPPAPHTSASPSVNQSGVPLRDGPMSLSSTRISTPLPLPAREISHFDSNTTTEVGPPGASNDTLDLDRRVVSQSLTQPPDRTADGPRLEDHDQSNKLA